MSLTAASLLATAISFAVFIAGAAWIVAPWMRRQPLAVALSVPLWIHAFRYVALQVFSAQHFGFGISNGLGDQIALGDVVGALLALAGLWLLRRRPGAAFIIIGLFAIETVVDLINATVRGIGENALESAQALPWMILTFYVPLLWVSLALLVWQLVSRRAEVASAPVAAAAAPVRHERSAS